MRPVACAEFSPLGAAARRRAPLREFAPALHEGGLERVRALFGEADAVEEREASNVSPVDADEGPCVATESAHLFEDHEQQAAQVARN